MPKESKNFIWSVYGNFSTRANNVIHESWHEKSVSLFIQHSNYEYVECTYDKIKKNNTLLVRFVAADAAAARFRKRVEWLLLVSLSNCIQ